MKRGLSSVLVVLLPLVWGCSGDGNDGRPSSSQTSGGITAGGETDGTASSATGGGGDGPEKFDIGGGGDGGNGGDNEGDDGCKKVDLLFVIDNSGSMADEQINLVNSFPGFIDQMQTQLATTKGYNVGVITTDSNLYNTPPCNVEGALVRQTGGASASNMVCTPYASGAGHMSELDDLATKFSCAGQVGTGGDGNERPMQTLQTALSSGLNAAGACNDGFIRDDALLVITVITDEEDDQETDSSCAAAQPGSPGDPQLWFDTVVSAKSGIEKNIVTLALIGPTGANACPPIDKCAGGIDGAEPAARIEQFANMFTNGFIGQVCAPDYGPFFADAVGLIESACENYTPPG